MHTIRPTAPHLLTRRALLRAGALLGVAGFRSRLSVRAQSGGARVIVIGAGIAGLAAARALTEQGFEVVVLEARDRVGGRLWTDRSLGVPVDLGGAWIHGIEDNPITGLAEAFGIATVETDYDDTLVYDAAGTPIDLDRADAVFERFEGAVARAKALGEELDQDISVAAGIDRVLGEDPVAADDAALFAWLESLVEVEAGAGRDELSLWWWDEDDGFGGADVLLPDGYDAIPRRLADGLDIRLGQTVRQIAYDDTRIWIETDGETIEGDVAVVTLPLGVLKSGDVAFAPALPEEKRGAIDRLGMGVLNKVVLKFPTVAWNRDHQWIGYVSDSRGEFPDFLNLASSTGDPVLVALTGGPFAHALEARSDDEVTAHAMRVLRMIDADLPEPERVLVTRWAADAFARGSYSFVPVGASLADYETLAAPVAGRLFFAGEATTSAYPATVHGAYLTGVRAAAAIGDAA